MTKIAEGRMVVTRIKLKIPPMRGEAVVREPDEVPVPAAETGTSMSISNNGSTKK